MKNRLAAYLSKNTVLSHEIINAIVDTAVFKSYEKGTIIQEHACFLVLKGCIRSYLAKDGEEKTIEFYTEEQPVSSLRFDINDVPDYFFECIEDTDVCLGANEKENDIFIRFPEFESACRIMAEKLMTSYKTEFANYKIASAKDRYLKLQEENPDLIQRVPQYQLASYLGIKPETLSRIRRKINKK